MKKQNNTGLIFRLAVTIIISWFPSLMMGQIYEPDGLRMPGTWNNWNNTAGMGAPFELQKTNTGTPRWQTTFQNAQQTTAEFKFVSTSFGNVWGNEWAGNQSITPSVLTNLTYGQGLTNNVITMTPGKWYTVVFEDLGYSNNRAIFMETSSEPVSITGVTQNPILVSSSDNVEIAFDLSGLPSPEEHFFVRYTTDNWNTSATASATTTANHGTATIPAQADNTEVEYYLFSSTFANPASDFDLITLAMNNNGASNFNYTVGFTIECDGAIDLLTTEPAFPQETGEVVVYFNAEFGNGGLFDYQGDVYAHTGVITNLSTSSTDWKYVKTDWGQNTPETKLEKLDDNLYSLNIQGIRNYYGVPSTEQILKLAFVFRGGEPTSGTSYPEHKNADGTDILTEVYQPALHVKIINPTARSPLASQNEVLPVCVEALQNQYIQLYLNNVMLTTEMGQSLAYPLVLQGYPSGNYWIKAVAGNSSTTVSDSVNVYLRGPVQVADLPSGAKTGINYNSDNTVTLVLADPASLKQFAFAIGEYSNWLPNDNNYMKRTPDGKHFWVTLNNLQPNTEYAYQYYIDGELKLADPYAEKVLDPWSDKWIPEENYPGLREYPFGETTGTVSVIQTNQPAYNWQISNFTPPAINETQGQLFIYELLLRDFTEERTLQAAMNKLDYLESIGVNVVELMPIAEFDGNESWGYAPNFFMAPDKYYGTKQNYQQFIDECHKRNIAVVLDIVTNHAYGQCPMVNMYWDAAAGQPSTQNPWFNPEPRHPFNIGYDFNHESQGTRQFIKDVLSYWLTEFKVDGFRFDLSKGLTQTFSGEDVGLWSQFDQSRINILTDYFNHIKLVNPNAYMILEHLSENPEQTVLANTGMLLWSAMHNNYKQVAMGWTDNSDVSWAYHANRGWNYPNLIDYMENHDEERLMANDLQYGNSAGNYNLKDTTNALHHMKMAAVLFMGIPGPKMLWQFGELGYDYSILYNGDRTAPKPPRWDYWQNIARQELYRTYAAMQTLRKTTAFRLGNFTSDLAGAGKRIWIAHESMNINISVNMGVTAFDMTPGFQHTGLWYNYFTGESINITDVNQSFNYQPGSCYVFTDSPLPVPFKVLNVTVTDSLSGNPVSKAQVRWNSDLPVLSFTDGNATLTTSTLSGILSIEAEGFQPWTKQLATSAANQQVTARLKRDGNFGVDDLTKEKVIVFPNPAKDHITIDVDEPAQIDLYSIDGRPISHYQISGTKNLIIRSLEPGIYLLKIRLKNALISEKITILK